MSIITGTTTQYKNDIVVYNADGSVKYPGTDWGSSGGLYHNNTGYNRVIYKGTDYVHKRYGNSYSFGASVTSVQCCTAGIEYSYFSNSSSSWGVTFKPLSRIGIVCTLVGSGEYVSNTFDLDSIGLIVPVHFYIKDRSYSYGSTVCDYEWSGNANITEFNASVCRIYHSKAGFAGTYFDSFNILSNQWFEGASATWSSADGDSDWFWRGKVIKCVPFGSRIAYIRLKEKATGQVFQYEDNRSFNFDCLQTNTTDSNNWDFWCTFYDFSAPTNWRSNTYATQGSDQKLSNEYHEDRMPQLVHMFEQDTLDNRSNHPEQGTTNTLVGNFQFQGGWIQEY